MRSILWAERKPLKNPRWFCQAYELQIADMLAQANPELPNAPRYLPCKVPCRCQAAVGSADTTDLLGQANSFPERHLQSRHSWKQMCAVSSLSQLIFAGRLMEGLCAVTVSLSEHHPVLRSFSFSRAWPGAFPSSPEMQNFSFSLAACWLKGICYLFQKDHGYTSALTSATCGCHEHQALFTRCVVGIQCSASKEPLSAVPLVTFAPEGLYSTYSTRGWTGCGFLGLFSPHLGLLWDLLLDISTPVLLHHLLLQGCWCSNSRVGPSTRRNLALKNPLLTTFKIRSVNQKHIAKNTPSASRANSNKE